jgi:hypothetical protein
MRCMDPRRLAPRVRLDGLCGVVSKDELRYAALLDLSALGLKLERLFDPALASRVVQIEIELPGTDEIVWARGEVTYAHLTPLGGHHPNGQPRLRCLAGIRMDRIAGHDRRLLRDYVIETRRARRVAAAATLVACPAPVPLEVPAWRRDGSGTAFAPTPVQEEITWPNGVALHAACGT